MIFVFTFNPRRTHPRMDFFMLTRSTFFLMRFNVTGEPLSGANPMFVHPDLYSQSATSLSTTSDLVPIGNCQAILMSREIKPLQNATIQSFLMIAVKS